ATAQQSAAASTLTMQRFHDTRSDGRNANRRNPVPCWCSAVTNRRDSAASGPASARNAGGLNRRYDFMRSSSRAALLTLVVAAACGAPGETDGGAQPIDDTTSAQ